MNKGTMAIMIWEGKYSWSGNDWKIGGLWSSAWSL